MSRKPADLALAAIRSQPWAITEEALAVIQEIAARGAALDVEAVEARLGKPLQNTRAVMILDGIATIPVTGPLFRYANLFTRISGATSFEELAKDFQAAIDDPAVRGIILAINSPGGTVDGTLETAKLILEARGAKPIHAHIDGLGASAAFWIASAAERVTLSGSSIVGSIGAVVRVSVGKSEDEVELVSSVSPNKRPDISTDAGRAEIQRVVDALGQVFVESVAANLAIPVGTVLAAKGGVMVGEAAVAAQLAHAVTTYAEVHAAMVARTRGPQAAFTGRPAAVHPEGLMAETPARLTRAQLEQEYATEIAAITGEKVAAAVTAERERLAAIDKLANQRPGHAELVAKAKADGAQTAATLALAIAEAEAAARGDRAQQLLGDERAMKDKPAPGGAAELTGDAAVVARVLSIHQQLGGQKRAPERRVA